MRFTKMHGLGNDFLLVYGQVPENAGPLCAALCDRRFGVGADGVIFLCASSVADCNMRIFNADGSEANMCGNGIRCAGKYVYDHGLTQKTELTVETRSGIRNLTLKTGDDGKVNAAAVDMGNAKLLEKTLLLPMGTGMAVSVGNPHAVCFADSVKNVPLSLWGPMIEHDERFPDGVNVEFVQVLSPQKLRMRVWERGCGITMACGTGACASVFAAVKRGLCPVGEPVEVKLDGGSLFITADETDHIRMEGPAVTVFSGEVAL